MLSNLLCKTGDANARAALAALRQRLQEFGPGLSPELVQAPRCISLRITELSCKTVLLGRTLKAFPIMQLTFLLSQNYSNFPTIAASYRHALQQRADVHPGFVTAPSSSSSSHLGMPLQSVTQTAAYFRNTATTKTSKHLNLRCR